MADERVPGTDPQPSEEPREILQEWPAWLILIALWGGSLLVVFRLPARVPMHWNIRGEVDRWGGPWEAALLIPALVTGVYLLILALDWGRLDFKAARGMTAATRRQVRLLTLLLMGTIQGLILGTILSGVTLKGTLILACIALFFIFLGNLMPRLEPNAWVGIRIPPTLESREVWKATHRLGGRILVVGGALLLPVCLLPESLATIVFLSAAMVLMLIPVVYAYRLRSTEK